MTSPLKLILKKQEKINYVSFYFTHTLTSFFRATTKNSKKWNDNNRVLLICPITIRGHPKTTLTSKGEGLAKCQLYNENLLSKLMNEGRRGHKISKFCQLSLWMPSHRVQKMSFLRLHSHPYALYLRRSHIPICVDNLTSSRLKNFLRLLLSVNKEFEEVTSNTHCLAVYMTDFY